MKLPEIQPGKMLIVRINGAEEVHERVSIREIERLIGASSLDTVILKHRPTVVMLVDDTGMIDHRPVKSKATELYHAVCKPGTVYAIHGDVAIANDNDFR